MGGPRTSIPNLGVSTDSHGRELPQDGRGTRDSSPLSALKRKRLAGVVREATERAISICAATLGGSALGPHVGHDAAGLVPRGAVTILISMTMPQPITA